MTVLADVVEHDLVIAVVVLAILALVVFLIRGGLW